MTEALPDAKEGCRFHDLRHSCAALLIERGVGLLEISRHMGHKSVATTGDVYGHLYETRGSGWRRPWTRAGPRRARRRW